MHSVSYLFYSLVYLRDTSMLFYALVYYSAIPLYDYPMICCSTIDHCLDYFQFGAMTDKASMSILVLCASCIFMDVIICHVSHSQE